MEKLKILFFASIQSFGANDPKFALSFLFAKRDVVVDHSEKKNKQNKQKQQQKKKQQLERESPWKNIKKIGEDMRDGGQAILDSLNEQCGDGKIKRFFGFFCRQKRRHAFASTHAYPPAHALLSAPYRRKPIT